MHSHPRKLTDREQWYCKEIAGRLDRIRELLNTSTWEGPNEALQWYQLLSALKAIQGNASNDVSFVGTLLAKQFLLMKHDVSFCAAEKAQGASGLDIDVTTDRGERVVGEIKTTVPYQNVDLGAQQVATFKKDVTKLIAAEARYKYFFVTEPSTFEIVQKPKYSKLMPGVTVVLLTTGEEHINES